MSSNSDVISSPSEKDYNFFVVGIGASAGGLRALEEFFENMPTDSGAAFVVIQHLSPDFKSLMKELLERRTRMPIYRVKDGMVLESSSVYLIPPGKNLVVANKKLHLMEQEERSRHGPNFPIDIFLESLAKNYAERAIGVILSGTGSDGTNGLRAINEGGGLAMVQDPLTAEFDGMPRTAISTGVVDQILSPKNLAGAIYQLVRSPIEAQQFSRNSNKLLDSFKLQRIASILAKHEQIDFSHYKTSTLSRRIHRRCLISGCNSLEDYVKLLETSPEERSTLRHDLLISVTKFFRDLPAWKFLETKVIPQTIEQAKPGEELRFWVTACATGEEAYSLAILLDEAVEKLAKEVKVKIFATDIDKEALHKATQGIYSETIVNDLSAERLQRYFIRKDNSFQVIRRLREKLLFAPHDLTKDAGFTRMNLISCRNVLIYMQPELQQQVLRNLHFSLGTKGILFLGEAETLGDFDEEFRPLNKKAKIFQKLRDTKLPLFVRGVEKISQKFQPLSQPQEKQESRLEPMLDEAFSSFLAEQKATCFLVDRQNKLFHVFNQSLEVLKFSTGRTTTDVTKLVVPALQLPLTTALHRAGREHRPVAYSGIKLNEDERAKNVKLKVTYHQTNKLAGDFFMVIIQEEDRPQATDGEPFEADRSASQRIMELEYELQQNRENLQAVIEELETTNEEQQATNEELIASNEELQSTNEELHSVNEELYTVNAEYQSKIEELTELNNDIDNLLRSTNIGVVFLDLQLKIRKFTPAATVAINLVQADIGRPLEHITHNLNCSEILKLLGGVIESQQPLEKEVQLAKNEKYLLMRVNPYLQEDGRLDGVVLTFVDIDEIKKVQQQLSETNEALRKSKQKLRQVNEELERRVEDRTLALQENEQRLRAILNNTTSLVYLKDVSGRYQLVNPRLLELLGRSEAEVLGKTDLDLFPEEIATALVANDRQVLKAGVAREFEEQIQYSDGFCTYIAMKAPLCHENGEPYAVCGISTNITQQKQTEIALRESAARERAILKVVEKMRQTLDLKEILRATTEELRDILQCDRVSVYRFNKNWSGQFVAESVSSGWVRLVHEDREKVWEDSYLQETEGGRFRQHQSYAISDIYQANLAKCHVELLEQFQARSFCIVPVFNGNTLWGLLSAYQNDRPRQWTLGETKLLTQVGIQLGVSVQQSGLFTQIQNQSQALQKAKEEAEAANQAKSAFIAHTSHELRTPLNAILGFAQIFKRDTHLTPSQINAIEVIRQSGEHLLTLINDILYLAKIEAGKLELELRDFHFPSFLDNLLAITRLRAEQKGLSFTYQSLSTLPTTVRCDETRLRQVLLNLLGNAVKFTNAGRVYFKVGCVEDFEPKSPEAEQKQPTTPKKIRFQVEDTGIGIPADKLTEIFLPFEQLDNDRSPNEGTGLGLTISQNIIRLLGEEIKVNSTPRKGSVFWFDLDLVEVESDDRTTTIANKPAIVGYRGKKRKILVVEDLDNNRKVLVNFLQPLDFNILEAKNGDDALVIAIEHQPDLILLDLVMPGMDGLQLTKRLRQEPLLNQIAIVCISANTLPQDQSSCDRVGCNGFLPKPVVLDRLLEVIEAQLGLQWIIQQTSTLTSSSDRPQPPIPPTIIPPPSQELAVLQEIAIEGDLRGILSKSTHLEQLDRRFIPFAQKLRQLAESCQVKKLQQFIKKYSEEE